MRKSRMVRGAASKITCIVWTRPAIWEEAEGLKQRKERQTLLRKSRMVQHQKFDVLSGQHLRKMMNWQVAYAARIVRINRELVYKCLD
jgi:hypothetical protein